MDERWRRHGLLGNFVKRHALDRNALVQALVAQDFLNMPGDSLSFAVRIACQINGVGVFDRLGNFANRPVGAVTQFPVHRKIFVGTYGTVLRRQIPNMTIGSQHGIIAAQILIDSLRLGWRFYDDEFVRHYSLTPMLTQKRGRELS